MLRRSNGSADERRLARVFRALSPADRETLLAMAEFLAHRAGNKGLAESPREPLPLPRPETETVIGAIKRLSRAYEMLARETLLHETSALMSSHVLQGREAAEVIDELESLFARRYREYRAGLDAQPDLESGPRD